MSLPKLATYISPLISSPNELTELTREKPLAERLGHPNHWGAGSKIDQSHNQRTSNGRTGRGNLRPVHIAARQGEVAIGMVIGMNGKGPLPMGPQPLVLNGTFAS